MRRMTLLRHGLDIPVMTKARLVITPFAQINDVHEAPDAGLRLLLGRGVGFFAMVIIRTLESYEST